MPYNAKAVANYLLNRFWRQGKQIDQLKLQKLLYFAHGWSLGLYGKPLLNESIKAWKFGPVVESIYLEFKDFGGKPIDRIARYVDDASDVPMVPSKDSETIALLDRICEVYGDLSGLRLSDMTHKDGTPWAQAWNKARKNISIPDDIITQYFRTLSEPGQSVA